MLRSRKFVILAVCISLCVAIIIPVFVLPNLAQKSKTETPSQLEQTYSSDSSNPRKDSSHAVTTPESETSHMASSHNSNMPSSGSSSHGVWPHTGGIPTNPIQIPVHNSNKNTFPDLQKKYNLINIPTYDGSNQLTHPKVLFFPNSWNGYRYWMSMTPYPDGVDVDENPSIVASNDGRNWSVPAGEKNPVSGMPPDVQRGGHYSDPHLVMKGSIMELWYRYNPALVSEKNERHPNNDISIYYRKTTTDGVHWSAAQQVMQTSDGNMSLCVNYEDDTYKVWYATYHGALYYDESKTGTNWVAPKRCVVPLPGGMVPYHQDIIRYGSKYYLLQTTKKAVEHGFKYSLFLFESTDGIHFGERRQLFPSKSMMLWNDVSFYRSTIVAKDNQFLVYVSMILPGWKWYMTQMSIPIPDDHSDSSSEDGSSHNSAPGSNPKSSLPGNGSLALNQNNITV